MDDTKRQRLIWWGFQLPVLALEFSSLSGCLNAVHTEQLTPTLAKSVNTPSATKGTTLVHLDFMLTGVVMTLLGPMLPLLSVRWSLSDAQAGNLFVVQFVTSVFGMLLSGMLVERLGYRRTLMGGLVLMALGMAALAQFHRMLGMVAVGIFGVGFGSNTPAGNLFVADANPGTRAASLNWLNSSWGIGALSSPLLVAWAQRTGHLPAFLYGLAVGLLVLAVFFGWARFAVDAEMKPAKKNLSGGAIWNFRIPLVAGLFFIYVGTETCAGGWVASYARRMDAGSHSFWALTPAFFWGAMLIGRMTAPLLLGRLRETTVASAGLTIAIFGITVLLLARSMTPIVVGASLSGLGLASVFPISVSMLARWFGENSTRVSGAVFSGGNLGGAALPWLVGALSTRYGSLRIGFVVPLLGALIMLAVYAAAGLSPARPAEYVEV